MGPRGVVLRSLSSPDIKPLGRGRVKVVVGSRGRTHQNPVVFTPTVHWVQTG